MKKTPDPFASPDFRVEITLRADPLSSVMLVTVTLVALLVAIYSVGYMHGDPGYWRFFTYIGLFVFSMTMLVSASNFLLLYVFWEAVGLCSYLLIGFWYHKPEAAAAGKKAFLVNRVGDFGFALGVFLIWTVYGSLNFHDTATGFGVLGKARLESGALASDTVGTAICLLLLLGACGKSAQLPLHVWLPDAMEGPTPVSALIHAATMVTAGVYMVARCAPLFAVSVDAQQVVAVIGGLTALVGAIIAMSQYDLKRILAYSTISQLGYMFLGLGAGAASGNTAGMFHLVTHAFFKGLLFLGAGSVMHSMGGVIDIRRLGGLRRIMPVTCWTFLIGCLALAGVCPLAGFWSKDAILAAVHHRASEAMEIAQSLKHVPLADAHWQTSPVTDATLYQGLYLMGLITAGLTAFYSLRAFFLVFCGPERIPAEAGHHAHESPRWMTVPLVILAVASVGVGMWLELSGSLASLLARTPSMAALGTTTHAEPGEGHFAVAAWSTVVALLGIGFAWLMYVRAPQLQRRVVAAMEAVGLYRLSAEKFFVDQVYQMLIVWPLEGVARLAAWFDRWVIDGLVDLVGAVPRGVGALLRPIQAGLIPLYALAMLVGLLLLLGTLLVS
jgi:NADH-quinone oxidoreductase subunit L